MTDKLNTEGRKTYAARPPKASAGKRGPERYPSTRQDDGVEARSFKETPTPAAHDRLGPAGDPAEGKR